MHKVLYSWLARLGSCMNWKESRCFLTKVVMLLLTFEVTLAQEYSCQNDTDCNFLHLAYFKNSEKENIYIGAKNKLLQVQFIQEEETFGEERAAEMGPQCDFVSCKPNCEGAKELMDNYNKILLVNKESDTLIVCGTLYQGICELRSLRNISNIMHTSELRKPELWVTPNTRNDSTVAILVPSPVNKERQAMVVGVTFAHQHNNVWVPEFYLALSTRSLQTREEFKELASITLKTNDYHIFYRAGFIAKEYIYFLTNQKFDRDVKSSRYVSKIQRVCSSSNNYNSLMDMVLTCEDMGKTYPLLTAAHLVDTDHGEVLVAGFTDGLDPEDLNSFNSSAICVFNIGEINGRFQMNLDNCLKVQQVRKNNIYWYDDDAECTFKNTIYVGNGSCDISRILQKKYKGIIGQEAYSSRRYDLDISAYYTAIQSTKVADHSVLYLGTSTGDILKAHLKQRKIDVYGRVTIDQGNAVSADLLLDSDKTHLFAMTKRKVMRFPVHNCSAFETCESCLESNDPYCGWCVQKQRCTGNLNDCPNQSLRNHWLSAVGEQDCPSLSIKPLQVHIQDLKSIMLCLSVKSMPAGIPNEQYLCRFSPNGRQTNGLRNEDSVTCPLPDISPVPHSVSMPVDLSLVTNVTGKPIAKKTFQIVDCTQEKNSCLSCVSDLSCFWCVHGSHCTYNSSLCGGKFVEENTACPRLIPSQEQIPNNSSKSVSVHGTNFFSPGEGNFYRCIIRLKQQKEKSVPAEFESNHTVVCNPYLFQYENNFAGELEGTIILTWNNNVNSSVVDGNISVNRYEQSVEFFLNFSCSTASEIGAWLSSVSKPGGLYHQLTVYKCEVLGTDFSTCGSYDRKFRPKKNYKCYWCNESPIKKCRYSPRDCVNPSSWPSPEITSVTPTSAHIRGETLVTISGRELGRGYMDVKSVKLAGQECIVEKKGFQVSFRIVCRTRIAEESVRGGVSVTVQNKTGLSAAGVEFYFGNPEITGIWPTKGPRSGGTQVTLKGKDLRIGSSRKIYLQNTNCINCTPVECVESKTFQDDIGSLICITGSVSTPAVYDEIVLEVDSENFKSSVAYNYTEDPKINSIQPRTSFASGGRLINVSGTYLSSIQSPKMFVTFGGKPSTPVPCSFSDEDNFGMIHCRTPNIDSLRTSRAFARKKRQADSFISIGFEMDNVAAVRNTGMRLVYFEDPVYNNLSDSTPFKGGKLLYITGKNLTAAATIRDVKVTLCNSSCMIKNMNNTDLICTMPWEVQGCFEKELDVKVTVGYARYDLGSLVVVEKVLPLEYILPSVIVSVILLVLLIVMTLKFRHHKEKRQRDMERIQNQYELLERNVRQEARQEFADLQQDIKLVTSDVIRHGVPYKQLSHYTYAMLFPADIMAENPLLNHSQSGGVDENFNQSNLKQLDSLVGNKFFLLTCLRALEMEKKMTARDKSYLANVMTVILLDKLDYMMQIWMELFKEHVSRAVERKQQKQIMRRNETIVEKMISNWLSLCMYHNMKNHTGSSLYMLYKATEMLTDYGPVDAVTGEAHYTLCEERLLKETIRNEQMTITVNVVGDEYCCKVLDCDAVSQVKQKCLNQIYTSAPVSERPREDQVDLEWHCGKNGRLILNNFDNTTEADGEWRRINTLKHYNVKNESKMALLSKEDEGIETDSPYGNLGCSSASLICTNDITCNVDEYSRIWHLVRTEDDKDDSKQCVISEIYLTRLMSTKVPLLNFLDHFVETVFDQSHMPMAVKFLFDYFDQLALANGLHDSDVCHIWKSNTLPIRYWGNLLKAPHHAFDVFKPDLSEPSLDVLAQCFIDSCSLSELRMGKDSPASKLLFSRDVSRYRNTVSAFYDQLQSSPAVSEHEVTEEVSNLSMELRANNLFSRTAAFYELSKVVKLHECKIIEALEENPEAKKLQLGHKLEKFLEKMPA